MKYYLGRNLLSLKDNYGLETKENEPRKLLGASIRYPVSIKLRLTMILPKYGYEHPLIKTP